MYCLCASEDYDTVVSASHGTDPQCLIHSLRTGMLIRTLPVVNMVDCVTFSNEGTAVNWYFLTYFLGYIVLYHRSVSRMAVFNLNATKIAETNVEPLSTMTNSPDSKWVVAANVTKGLSVRRMSDLQMSYQVWFSVAFLDYVQFDTECAVTAFDFVGEGKYIMAGLLFRWDKLI